MKITAPWVTDPPTQALFAAFGAAGITAYFVGGCVRNALLGQEVADLDLSTAARPRDVIAAVEGAGLRAVPTGVDHGTVTCIALGRAFEVTTFRRDVETDGRRAVVAFAETMVEDARRRDFTMNALYADQTGVVIDPVAGLPDLLAGHVRFIDDPQVRIREDYLRILRFFRFSARYTPADAGLDADGLAACAALQDGLEGLARERVGAEMRALLSAPDPTRAVAAMAQTGILARLLPGADPTALGPLVHLEGLADRPPDPIRRLAALGGADVPARLRLSRGEGRQYEQLLSAAWSTDGPAILGYRYGANLGQDALLLRQAQVGAPVTPDALTQVAWGADQTCPVTAADFKADYQGAALGAALKRAEARWIASGFALGKDALLS